MNSYENTDYNYYNYINNVNNSIQNILDIYRLQHETIRSNNLYYYNYHYPQQSYNNPETINPIQNIPVLNDNNNDNDNDNDIDNHNDNDNDNDIEDQIERRISRLSR